MRDQTKNIINSTPESRQSKDMFRSGYDAEIINRTNYGSNSYNITYSNVIIPAQSNGCFYRGATVMLDGRVFLSNNYTSNSAVYDPISDTITSCINANVNDPNFPGYGSLLLKDGRIFIPPFYVSNNDMAQARIYDPTTNVITNFPRLYNPGDYINAIALNDGRVYLGPYNCDVTAKVLNVDTNEILTLPMLFPGGCNASGVLPDGRVCSPKYSTNFMYIWNPGDNTYETVELPSDSEYVNTMCVMSDGRLFITQGNTGGQNCGVIFDPLTNISYKTSLVPNNPYMYICTAMVNGKVAILAFFGNLSVVFIYDPKTDNYSILPNFEGTVQYSGCTVLPDGRMMLAPQYTPNSSETARIAFIGEKLPKQLPLARTCSPVYNRF